jgi:hypothetical protein
VLLNIGCGSGEYDSVARAMDLHVIGCEPEAHAYELAVAAASGQVMNAMMRWICGFESHVAMLMGTSVLARVRKPT